MSENQNFHCAGSRAGNREPFSDAAVKGDFGGIQNQKHADEGKQDAACNDRCRSLPKENPLEERDERHIERGQKSRNRACDRLQAHRLKKVA